jgi:hypothetical protein
MLTNKVLTDELILYFAAAAREATGKGFYFMKYAENQLGRITVYYAALDGDRLVLIYDDSGDKEVFTVNKGRQGPEPFNMGDHQDVIRAIKHVYKGTEGPKDDQPQQRDGDLSM